MAVRRVQLRRGTHAQNDGFTGAVGEITVDTDNNSIRVHDGATAGGTETLMADMSNLGNNVLAENGTVSFKDLANNTTVRLIDVADPTNAQDVATKAYVDSGGAGEIRFSELGDTTIAGAQDGHILLYDADTGVWWNKALSGDASIADTGVITLANGAITAQKIDIISDSAISNAKLANSTVTITDGTTSDTLALGTTLTLNDVANETTVAVTADVPGAGAVVTIGLPDDVTIGQDLTVTRNIAGVVNITTTGTVDVGTDLTVGGNLTVNGTQTILNSTTVSTADRIIELNNGIGNGTSNVNDLGLFLNRGSDADAIFIWDEGEDTQAGAFVLATHGGTVDGTTTDFSAVGDNGGLTYAPLHLSVLTAHTSATVLGDTTIKADNATFDIQTSGGASKFSVDTDNGNTSVAGTLGVTGIATFDDTVKIPTGATTSSILINSDLAGAGAQDANILAVERGTTDVDATLTWDETNDSFIASNIFHSVGGLSIGGADPTAQTASLSSAGALSLDAELSVGTTLTVTSTTSLGGSATLDTDAVLLVKAGTAETERLIVLNNDVDGGQGSPAAQDAYIAVRRGVASYATIHWDEGNTLWALSNSASVGTNLSVGNDLTVTGTASVNALEVKTDGLRSIVLNSDLGNGVNATVDVGITVERGADTDASIYFDETADNTWKLDRGDGGGAKTILVAGDTIPNSDLANSVVSITDGTTTDTLALGTTLTLSNVNNETTVAVSADAGAGATVTIGLPDSVTLQTGLTVGSLTISDGSIDDTDGSIAFGATNFTGVGTIASSTITVGTTSLASGSITDTSGTVSFGDDNVATTGALQIKNGANVALGISANADNATITSHGGNISFSDENLTSTGKITAGTFESGASTFTSNVTVKSDNATFDIQKADTTSVFSVDTDNGNTNIEGTLNVTGIATIDLLAQLDGGIDVGASLFTVTGANGNVLTEGTLRVKGATTLDGNVLIYDDTTDPIFTIKKVAGAAETFKVLGASGNTTIAGTLALTGVGTFTSALVPSANGGASLGINGTRWGNVFTDALTVTSNTTIGGTLGVTSTSTFTGLATFNGGIAGENGFSIADVTGAVSTDSTLSVGGQATFEAGISSINGNAGLETFGVLANGNTTIAGTLGLAKTATINSADGSADLVIQNNTAQKFLVEGDTGNTDIEGTLNVAGNTEIETGNLTITTGNATITAGGLTLTAGGITATAAASSFQAVSATSLSQSGGTLTLVSGGGAATDAFLKVERGNTDADIKWDETADKWKVNHGTGNFYSILDSNTTLFRLTANGSSKDFSLQGTDAFETLTFSAGGGVNITHAGNGTVTVGLNSSQTFTGAVTITGETVLTNASLKISDPLLILANGNSSKTAHTGFYTQYDDTNGTDTFAGLVFQPDENTRTTGADTSTKRFKLFSTVTGLNDTEVIIAPTDNQLGDLDLGNLNVKGGELTVTKSTATHTEGDNGDVVEELSSGAISLTYTFNGALADAATSEVVTVTTDKAVDTSVVIGTSSLQATVEVFAVASGSFKFRFTNISGGAFADLSTGKFNFVIL